MMLLGFCLEREPVYSNLTKGETGEVEKYHNGGRDSGAQRKALSAKNVKAAFVGKHRKSIAFLEVTGSVHASVETAKQSKAHAKRWPCDKKPG